MVIRSSLNTHHQIGAASFVGYRKTDQHRMVLPEAFTIVCVNYKSQKQHSATMEHRRSPDDYCVDWNLDGSALDKPWATLSGDEAQRASLAIAMTLEPDIFDIATG